MVVGQVSTAFESMTSGGSVSDGTMAMPTTLRSSTTTKEEAMRAQKLAPVHPGEVLLEEFLKPMDLSQNRLALAIGVPPRRINEIVLGKRGISADTALRLARYFSMSSQFWMGLQMDYELDCSGRRAWVIVWTGRCAPMYRRERAGQAAPRAMSTTSCTSWRAWARGVRQTSPSVTQAWKWRSSATKGLSQSTAGRRSKGSPSSETPRITTSLSCPRENPVG